MSMDKNTKIKIMVASTVYGFEDQLKTVVAQLNTMGYRVINSHIGAIKVNPELSNLENCLNAVDECDLFLGIIRPYYGSGNIGEKNITFEEIKRAIELKKPHWFLVHHDVDLMRRFIKQFEPKDKRSKLFDVVNIKTGKNPDYRSINIYNHVLKENEIVEERKGNWVQEFYSMEELMTFIQEQFSDKKFITDILEQKEANNGK